MKISNFDNDFYKTNSEFFYRFIRFCTHKNIMVNCGFLTFENEEEYYCYFDSENNIIAKKQDNNKIYCLKKTIYDFWKEVFLETNEKYATRELTITFFHNNHFYQDYKINIEPDEDEFLKLLISMIKKDIERQNHVSLQIKSITTRIKEYED